MLKDSFVLVESVLSCLAVLRVFFQTRGDTALEILALRQQLAVLKRKRPRPQLDRLDRIFWTVLRRCWSCAWRIHKIKRLSASGTTRDSASASDTKQSLSVTQVRQDLAGVLLTPRASGAH